MNDLIIPSRNELEDLRVRLNIPALLDAAVSVEVWDETSATHATDVAKLLSEALRATESERKTIVKPFNDGVKAINQRFKDLVQPLNDALAGVRSKLLTFQKEQRRLAEEQARAAREAMAAQQVPTPVTPVDTGPSRGQLATSSTRVVWKYRVVDAAAVPRQFCSPDDRKLRDAVSSGTRDIPGVEIFQEANLVIR